MDSNGLWFVKYQNEPDLPKICDIFELPMRRPAFLLQPWHTWTPSQKSRSLVKKTSQKSQKTSQKT